MKKFVCMAVVVALVSLASSEIFSQSVSINADGSDPNANAMLDVVSPATGNGKGMLAPRLTLAQRTTTDSSVAGGLLDSSGNLRGGAAQGLLVYQTDGAQGFYYNSSSTSTPSWVYLGSGSGTVTSITASSPLSGGTITTTGTVGISKADASTDGYLDNDDFARFDGAYTSTNSATNANTASTIVKRDASGNFSASSISANLTGNVTGNVSGTAANVTGMVALANGGTGAADAATARTNLGLGSISTQNSNAVSLTGGAIDGTGIGATSPSTGGFTSIAVNNDGADPNSNALLDLASPATGNGKGMLAPRVSQAQRTTANSTLPGGLLDDSGNLRGGAAQGLLVYQTDGTQGLYHNTSLTSTPAWVFVGSGSGSVSSITASSPLSGGTITESGTIGIPRADATNDGYLDNEDFISFNSAYTATSSATEANTPSTIVRRDTSGNFTAGTVTAGLTGNVTGNVTGNLTGNVTGNVTGDCSGNAGTVTNGVYTTGDQTIAGTKTFSSAIIGNLTGNVTGNCSGSSGSCTGNAATATSAGNVTGTVALANGGTGATDAAGARAALELNTMALQRADAVTITGGNIDGVTIGYSSRSPARFTSVASETAYFLGTTTYILHQGLNNYPSNLVVGNGGREIRQSIFPDGLYNTFTGIDAGIANTTGYLNTANGYNSLNANKDGFGNTAIGGAALKLNESGIRNTAVGSETLGLSTTGSSNTAVGHMAMWENKTGSENTAVGQTALNGNTSGSQNTAVGIMAGAVNGTGTYNTFIGYAANPAEAGLINCMALGTAAEVNASNKVVIGNSSVTTIGGYSNWSNYSDARVKKNISDCGIGLSFIEKLRPVNYRYSNQDKLRNGFIAQDVEKACDELGIEFGGLTKPENPETGRYMLSYSEFVVPLVNAVKELKAENDELKAEIKAIKERLGM